MQRNLDRRVETTFPVENKNLKKYLKENVLDVALADNEKSRVLLPTGKYVFNRKVYTEENINLQEYLMDLTVKINKQRQGEVI